MYCLCLSATPLLPTQALYYDVLLVSGLLTESESQFITRAAASDGASTLTFRPRFKGRLAQDQYRCVCVLGGGGEGVWGGQAQQQCNWITLFTAPMVAYNALTSP